MKNWIHRVVNSRLTMAVIAVANVSALLWWFSRQEPTAVRATHPLENISLAAPDKESSTLLRPEIVEALGLGEPVAVPRRLELLRSIHGQLSDIEKDAVLAALLDPRPPTTAPGPFSECFHRMAVLLQRQDGDRSSFSRVLATIARDGSRDEVIRDYAIQNLRQAWDRSNDSPGLRASIEATFRELCSSQSEVSASALLSLHLLGTTAGGEGSADVPASRSYALPSSDLEPLVVEILRGPASANAVRSRMTAARVAGDRKLSAAKDSLLSIASDEREHALVRMAAVHALAKVADVADLSSLSSIESNDPRVGHAIATAMASPAPSIR